MIVYIIQSIKLYILKEKMSSKVSDKNDSSKVEVNQPNEIPINKYSIYEMKSAIDTKIVEHLENKGYKEDNYLSNVKIAVGMFCLFFTGLAYLYPKPFPENYNVVLVSVVM